jgi:exopolysaccharide production protein ExoZ
VAVFAVMVHHSLTAFGPPLTGVMVGAAGVDVIFVISGVVIGYMDHDDGALRFAFKRVIRVVPLYWLATLFYGFFRNLVLHDEIGWDRVLRSLFLVPDFSTAWVPIYYPGWSLCFELSFYAIFGLLLPLKRLGTTKAALLGCLFLAAVSIPVPFAHGAHFDTRPFAEFAAGLLLSELARVRFRLPTDLAVLSIALSALGFGFRYGYPDEFRIINWGIPAILLVLGCMSLERIRLFSWRPLIALGDASYAIYLSHIPLMEMFVVGGAAYGVDLHSRIRFIILREVLMLGTALAGGLAIHRWLERPLLRYLRRLLPSRETTRILA